MARSWGQVKPPPGAQIDWGHPLAQGLTFCALFNERSGRPIDLVRGGMSAYTGTPPGWVRPGAYESDGIGGNYTKILTDKNLASTARATVRAKFWPISFGSGGDISTLVQKGDGSRELAIWFDASANWQYCALGGSTGSLGAQNVGVSISATVPLFYDMVFAFGHHTDGDGGAAYKNGVVVMPLRVIAAANWGTAGAGTGLTLARGDVNHSTIVYDQIQIWNRYLRPEEAAWLAAEPYAFVIPPGPEILYFDLGVAVGPTPITDTETGAGADAGESISAPTTGADTGAGADAGEAIVATPTDDQSWSSSDAGEQLGVNDDDTATFTEVAGAIAATPDDVETGAGAEAASLAATLADDQPATAQDADESISAALVDAEAWSSSDAGESMAIGLVDADAGMWAEASPIVELTDADLVFADDAGESLVVYVSDGDSATAVEDGVLGGFLEVNDVDTVELNDAGELLATGLTDTDTATSVEAEAPIVLEVTDTEIAAFLEIEALEALVGTGDVGTWTEHGSVFKPTTPACITTTAANAVTITTVERDACTIMTTVANAVNISTVVEDCA